MRALGYFAVVVAIAACGESYDANISGVSPTSAFLGRKTSVSVSGDITEWSTAATVSFGDGITVDSVKVNSPSALTAEITISETATAGVRDVVVTDGGSKHTLTEGFTLESPIKVVIQGTLAQGSVALYTINNRDFDAPFDLTAISSGPFSPPEFTNVQITAPAGVEFQIGSVEPYTITGTAFFDLDAAPGSISVASGPAGEQIVSPLGENVDIKARSATALTSGMQVMGNVSSSFESQLYEITPAQSPALATFTVGSASAAAAPGVALLPSSGKWADLISYGPSGAVIQQTAGKVYAVYIDLDGGKGYSYNLRAVAAQLAQANHAEPNDTPNTAQVAPALPFLLAAANLSAENDQDWISFTVAAGDVGKRIHIMTTGGDPLTDTVVQAFQGSNPFGAPSRDTGIHENHLSPPIMAAGVYRVMVTGSVDWFDPAHQDYVVAIWLE